MTPFWRRLLHFVAPLSAPRDTRSLSSSRRCFARVQTERARQSSARSRSRPLGRTARSAALQGEDIKEPEKGTA